MKTRLTLLTLLVFAAGSAFAQQGNGQNKPMRDGDRPRYEQREPGQGFDKMAEKLDLSADQKTKIEALQTPHMKKMLASRNLLNEKQAQKTTLMSADKPDLNKINALIDEMAKIEADSQKEVAAHHVQVRTLLNDTQRVKFDAMQQRSGKDKGSRSGKGKGKGFKK